jgi:tetratricopeptide (TPR) repeat protein
MLPPNESKTAPFSGGGVKFTPMVGQELQLNQGQSLNFFYQIWDISGLRSPHSGKKLEVEYVYGRIGARDTQTVRDEISLDQLDPAGSLLNGKRILTGELSPGNYRLVLTLHDPATDTKVYGSLNFGVYSTTAPPAWDISDDGLSDDIRNGTSDNQRASCYLAFGDSAHALEWFRRAYSKNPADEKFRARLVDLYFAQKAYANVAELYANSGINQSTDEQTVLKIAESLDKGGDLKRAVAVMESGTNFHPSSGPLFIGLADYYRKSGDDQKAAAAERKGKQFLATPPTS